MALHRAWWDSVYVFFFSTDGTTGTERVEIYGMATCIPTYRLDDLREILRLITDSCYAGLAECRPLKVMNYLKASAQWITVLFLNK